MVELHNAFDKLGGHIDRAVSLVLGAIVITMFASLMLQVISRYFFDAPLSWPEEVTMFLMAWMTFLGASVALRSWGHLGVDYFLEKLSGKPKICLQLLIRLIVFSFCLFLLVEGCNYVADSTTIVSDGLRISMVYPRLSIPVGGALMLLHTVTFILGDLIRLTNREEVGHG